MASTSQKKTTKKTSGKSGSRTTAKKPQPRPIRREVGGVVCLVLALCVFVSYFGISAIFIDWLAVLIKGLLGYGYWLFGPALVLAGCILLFHHGRPVTLRVTSALLLPVLLGTLCHMLLVKEAYASSIGIIPAMWKDGVALKCGGVISGALGQGSVAVFSKIASIIIFTVLFVVLLMVALRLTVGALIEKHRERPKYEEEPEPEKPVGRKNNRKMTFDSACRVLLFDVAKKHGLQLEEKPEYGGRAYLEKQDYILFKQKEQLAAQEQKLEELTMKIEDVEALVDEVADIAYDKAVEVVADTVKLETHKEDIKLVEQSKAWVLSPERKASKKEIEYAVKRLDGVIARITNAMKSTIQKIQTTLMKPEVKKAGTEQIKKKAKSSIIEQLSRKKKEMAEREVSRTLPAKSKKQDMEL